MPPKESKEPKKGVEVLEVVAEKEPGAQARSERAERSDARYGGPGSEDRWSVAGDDLAVWQEEQEDEHVRSLYKAEKLLDDVLYRQNM